MPFVDPDGPSPVDRARWQIHTAHGATYHRTKITAHNTRVASGECPRIGWWLCNCCEDLAGNDVAINRAIRERTAGTSGTPVTKCCPDCPCGGVA